MQLRQPAAQSRTADPVVHEQTRSLCPECKRLIDAEVRLESGRVIMRKQWPEHGWFGVLISPAAEGYLAFQKYDKLGQAPLEYLTEVKDGCPHDCGLCPEHQQRACLALVEVNTGCNLACPTCFANAGAGYNLTLSEVAFMLDQFIRTEGDPEVVQFSGGEPTLHPQLFDMVRMAQGKGIRHVMVNTNGLRIAQDPEWAAEFGALRPMVYLQLDGLEDATYVKLRGEPLLQEKLAALDRLAELDLNTILVAAVERGVNEHEVGALVRFALEHPAVRGISFQPVTHTGRHGGFDPLDRVTIPDVVGRIQDQTEGLFVKSDFVPVPCCNPGCQSITYAYVEDGQVTPLPWVLNVDEHLDYITNRAWPDPSEEVRHALEALWSSSAVPGTESLAAQFTCAACNVDLTISNRDMAKRIFAITVKDFVDAYTFDVKKVAKCCVEIITPDGRLVPFCAYKTWAIASRCVRRCGGTGRWPECGGSAMRSQASGPNIAGVASSALRWSDQVAACCANVYSHPAARWLLGDSFHPGGLGLTSYVARLAVVNESSRVLDLGSGRGASAVHLAAETGCRVDGLTLEDAGAVAGREHARERGVEGRVSFTVGDVLEIAPEPEAFDLVLMECVLSILLTKEAALRRLGGALRRGGRLALTDVTVNGPIPTGLQGVLAVAGYVGDARPLEGYRALLEEAGLTIVHSEDLPEAAAQTVRDVKGRLLLAEVAAKLGKLPVAPALIDRAKGALTGVQALISDGTLGYGLLVAAKV